MLAKVVKSFPATRSITSRPRSASRRSPAAVTEPSGKAIAAAIPSRSGVSGVILSGGGIEAMAQQHISILTHMMTFAVLVVEQMVMTAKVELAASDLL